MAYTQLQIYNLALSAIGTRSSVNSLTEQSREVEVCNLHYEIVRDVVLRAAHWGVAKAYARLAVVKERDFSLQWAPTDPGPGWRFAYGAPSDMLFPRYIHTFERFELSRYGADNAIFSGTEQAILIYTSKDPPINLWDPDLYTAVISGLAASMAMQLHGKQSRAKEALERANNAILTARAQNANANEMQHETLPSWLTARGLSLPSAPSRYIYTYGPLLATADV